MNIRSALFALLGIALTTPAYAFSSVYAFGDSLSDNGNVYRASGGRFPPAPYDKGRFSNGPVMAEDLARDLGVPLEDNAWGGATTGTANTLNGSYGLSGLPGLGQEISQATQGPVDPNALDMIWAGANDYIRYANNPGAYPGGMNAVATSAAANIETAASTLAHHGARNILIINLPNLGATPDFSGAASISATEFSQSFNQVLGTDLNTLQQTPGFGATLYRFDAYAALAGVLADPASYGFTTTTSPCLDLSTGSLCSPDLSVQNTYTFWDGLHPTMHLHQLMASEVAAAVPEASPSVMFSFGLVAVAWASRRAKRSGRTGRRTA
ncbi:MAG: SGNH/GDSL hydrolase family protein [Acidiferrobacteraceae bacterium]